MTDVDRYAVSVRACVSMCVCVCVCVCFANLTPFRTINNLSSHGRRAIWRKAFVAWDADNSGDVDRDELRQVFRDVIGREISGSELDRVFERLDKDKSGKIEWEEFVDYFANLSKNFC